MATKTIQAPWVNFVIVTMTSTTPVIEAPTVLMARDRSTLRRASGRSRAAQHAFQCRTMPVWPRVKDVKTPTM